MNCEGVSYTAEIVWEVSVPWLLWIKAALSAPDAQTHRGLAFAVQKIDFQFLLTSKSLRLKVTPTTRWSSQWIRSLSNISSSPLFRRSLNLTCLRFSNAAISGFPRFTSFLTTRPHAAWNVNKPTLHIHSQHAHSPMQKHTDTHAHATQICMRQRVPLCFYFGPVRVLCKSVAPPLECFLVVK